MVLVPQRATTVEDLWDELAELTEQLTIDDFDADDDASGLDANESMTLLADTEEHVDTGDDDSISDRFVYTRFILRQSLRFQEYVSERLIGTARDSWDLITQHTAECPGIVAPDLEQRIAEVLDELVARSPIDVGDRFKHERWLPVLLNNVSQAIAARVADEPKLLWRMTPRAFEQFLGKVFLTFGYDVELTKQTCDGGYDVVALTKNRDGKHKLLIEAKRYRHNRPVGVALVRQILSVKADKRATRAVLATTSSFTKAAKELCRQHEYELELRDFDDLMTWARDCADLLRLPVPEDLLLRRRPTPVRRR
jgi:restriction endonuclease Mrr